MTKRFAFLLLLLACTACRSQTGDPVLPKEGGENAPPSAQSSAAATTSSGDALAGGTGLTEYRIGYIGPLSGTNADIGQDILSGIKLTVNSINDTHGLEGRLIVLLVEDGQCTASGALIAAEKLRRERVVAILGGQCDEEARALISADSTSGTVLLSSFAQADDLASPRGSFFRNTPSASQKLRAVVKYLKTNDALRVAILTEETDEALALRKAFLAAGTGILMVTEQRVPTGTKDFRSVIQQFGSGSFDTFVPISTTPQITASMAMQFRFLGNPHPIMLLREEALAESPSFASSAPEGVQYVTLPEFGKKYGRTDFENWYIYQFDKVKRSILYPALGCDAMRVLADALLKAGDDVSSLPAILRDIQPSDSITAQFRFAADGNVIGIPLLVREYRKGVLEDIELVNAD